jgi:hypothetical protein
LQGHHLADPDTTEIDEIIFKITGPDHRRTLTTQPIPGSQLTLVTLERRMTIPVEEIDDPDGRIGIILRIEGQQPFMGMFHFGTTHDG